MNCRQPVRQSSRSPRPGLPPSPVTCCVASRPWVPTQPPWRVRWRCSATATRSRTPRGSRSSTTPVACGWRGFCERWTSWPKKTRSASRTQSCAWRSSPALRSTGTRAAARRVKLLTAEAPWEQVAGYVLALRPGGGDSIEPLRRAASVASARDAPDLAVTYLRRALAEPPRRPTGWRSCTSSGWPRRWWSTKPASATLCPPVTAPSTPRRAPRGLIDLANAFAMLGRMQAATTRSRTSSPTAISSTIAPVSCWRRTSARLRGGTRTGTRAPRRCFGGSRASRPATQGPRGSRWRHVRHSLICRPGNCPRLAQELVGDALVTAPWIGNLLAMGTHLCRRVRPRIRHAGAGTPAGQA